MEYLKPEDFLSATTRMPVVDVRSPGEFASGHVTGSISLPLFADDERAIVGTIYKQQGKKDAIEKGLEIVGPKMAALAKKAEEAAPNGALGVYCWRGGMRNNRMAWLFEQVGCFFSTISPTKGWLTRTDPNLPTYFFSVRFKLTNEDMSPTATRWVSSFDALEKSVTQDDPHPNCLAGTPKKN